MDMNAWRERKKKLVEKYGEVTYNEIMILLLERLDSGTNKLNTLTRVLIALTIVLGILTAITIIRSYNIG
ncbi:hypothetical protein ACFLXD_06720 [Chloroflexota bacterium]